MTWDSQADSWAPANGAPTFSDEGAGATSSNHVEETYGDFGDNGPAGSGDRACFKCGETGHMKLDCPNEAIPREFTGECHGCGESGHRRSECPAAEPIVCKNCLEPGHAVKDCTNARKNPFADIPTCSPEQAWQLIRMADFERDVYDLKESCLMYIKGLPNVSFLEIHQALQNLDNGACLVALETEAPEMYTFMDAQGNLGKTYQVTFRFSLSADRDLDKSMYPKSAQENLERLKDAGIMVSRLMEKCSNCGELGHSKKHCSEAKGEHERAKVSCVNCLKDGHRSRDCTEERKDYFACKNCGKSGHTSKECTEPRDASTVECKECKEVGHFSRDCPTKPQIPCYNCNQVGHRKADCPNEAVLICRNCDAEGHVGKDCPKPKDWSRVKCRNCNAFGHSQVKCPEPVKEDAENGGADTYGGGAGGYGGTGPESYEVVNAGGGGW